MGKLKDNVAGKTKQIVGEVTGDGKLAEEGKEQVKKDQIEPARDPLATSTSRPELAISSRFFHPPDDVPSAGTVTKIPNSVNDAPRTRISSLPRLSVEDFSNIVPSVQNNRLTLECGSCG